MALPSDVDDLYYLAPGFDISSLTVPKLRSIFVTHDISYPSAAKKGELVSLFENELLPRAKRIIAARNRVRRTSKGIQDMSAENSQQGTVLGDPISDDDDDDTVRGSVVSRSTRASRSARSSAAPSSRASRASASMSASDISGDELRTPAVARRSAGRPRKSVRVSEPPSVAHSRASATNRSTRHSSVAQSEISHESEVDVEPTPRASSGNEEESFFTSDNPFQSGSSPVVQAEARRRKSEKLIREENGRASLPAPAPQARSKQRTPARHSEPARVKHDPEEMNRGDENGHAVEEDDEEEEDEDEEIQDLEWTAEERDELEQTRNDGAEQMAIIRRMRKMAAQPPANNFSVAKIAPLAILVALLAGYGAWYRREKLEVGYCGVGKPATTLADAEFPAWASFLQPQCEPCPPHAICYQNMQTICEHDFILNSNPLSLGGLIPIPPKCEPDGEKVKKVKLVADQAIQELRDRRAKFECGSLTDTTGHKVKSVEIAEQTLKASVSAKRRKQMSEDEFDDLWRNAMGEILSQEEIESGEQGTSLFLSSTSLARISLGCRIRRSARLTLVRYRFHLLGLVMLVGSILYARFKVLEYFDERRKVPMLVASALDKLANQTALYNLRKTAEAFVRVSQMRDDILRNEFSASKRLRIWTRVQKIVERNSNVRTLNKESRNGQVDTVWEWIGHTGDLEDSYREKESARAFQWGSSPAAGSGVNTPAAGGGRLSMGAPSWIGDISEDRGIVDRTGSPVYGVGVGYVSKDEDRPRF